MISKNDLRLLNTTKGLEYLLCAEKLDFESALKQLRYEEELVKLQIKMINVQNQVVGNGERVMILIEGREFAGKGGAIHAFTEHLNPRSMRMVALSKPTAKERGQWYFKRYIEQLPEAGEMVFFDRSWYNRALVEPVNGFCTKKQYNRFMKEVSHFERMLSEDGIKLIKLYFSISKKEQIKRIENVQKNPLRRWELSPIDLNAVSLWNEYSKYEKAMFNANDTKQNPWYVIKNDFRRKGRLVAFRQVIDLLSNDDKAKK